MGDTRLENIEGIGGVRMDALFCCPPAGEACWAPRAPASRRPARPHVRGELVRCTQDRNNGIIMTALTSLGLTGRSIPSYSVRL